MISTHFREFVAQIVQFSSSHSVVCVVLCYPSNNHPTNMETSSCSSWNLNFLWFYRFVKSEPFESACEKTKKTFWMFMASVLERRRRNIKGLIDDVPHFYFGSGVPSTHALSGSNQASNYKVMNTASSGSLPEILQNSPKKKGDEIDWDKEFLWWYNLVWYFTTLDECATLDPHLRPFCAFCCFAERHRGVHNLCGRSLIFSLLPI